MTYNEKRQLLLLLSTSPNIPDENLPELYYFDETKQYHQKKLISTYINSPQLSFWGRLGGGGDFKSILRPV